MIPRYLAIFQLRWPRFTVVGQLSQAVGQLLDFAIGTYWAVGSLVGETVWRRLLYYENRIPELQLVNENFSDELDALLEEAELDEDAEGQLARAFGTQYTLLTRPERLKTIAKDLVTHFVGRGFTGKAMYVGLDKAAAVRMYNFVKEAWAEHLDELRAEHDALPELERPWLASRVELMETTDMAVVVSRSQNDLKMLDDLGLDIRPHRERMNREDLAEQFKDSADPLRLVFVCAMWMTGFDAPSVSTVYLDRPMKNHTLMQTIARANRVFPEKDNGLIVDYVGVFRNLEKALAIYGAAEAGQSPIEIIDALSGELDAAVPSCSSSTPASGWIVSRCVTRKGSITSPNATLQSRRCWWTKRPGLTSSRRPARYASSSRPSSRIPRQPPNSATSPRLGSSPNRRCHSTAWADLGVVADAVDALLDRSVGAEEYVIRAVAEGTKSDPLIGLSLIDFEDW